MENNYDIIIAGGGVAGLYAARELSKAKLKVVLIDQTSTLGSTAWTPAFTIEKFSLPKEGINASFNELILGTLKKEKKWTSEKNIGYVMDYKRMSSLILKQAETYGCTVFTESTVNSLIKKNDEIIGVNTSKGDFYGKYIIDATGAAGILVSEAGLRKRVPCSPSVGIEIEIFDESQSLKKFNNAISVFFDTELFSCGYGWISTNGPNKYKVGLGEFEYSSFKNHVNLELRLEKFINFLFKDTHIKILEKHGGSIYAGPKFIVKKILYKNLLGIGDTIGTINPILGEGIRHALYSSYFAVQSIIENNNKGVDINNYEKKWKKYIGIRWKISSLISLALYEKNTVLNQNFYDQFLEFVNEIKLEEIVEIMQEYNLYPLLKKFPRNVSVITALFRARFFNFG